MYLLHKRHILIKVPNHEIIHSVSSRFEYIATNDGTPGRTTQSIDGKIIEWDKKKQQTKQQQQNAKNKNKKGKRFICNQIPI